MKKKVLIFHPTIAPYRVDFFNALNDAFELRICLRNMNLLEQHFDDYDAILRKCKFSPIYLRQIVKCGKRIVPAGIISQIREFKPDIVIGIEFSWETICALAFRIAGRQKYKVMTICDDSLSMVEDGTDFSSAHRHLRSIISPRLDEVILTSPEICSWYLSHFNKGCWFPIIRNGEDARIGYSEALDISNELCKKYALAGKTVFLYVGRLVDIKKVDDIIFAFKKACRKESMLVIAGGGVMEPSLKETAGGDSRILFTGRLEGRNLLAWYNIASVLILASSVEPFGAVTDEALIGGCDVLVSRQCGSACLVSEGINGHLFDSGNTEQLSELMVSGKWQAVPDNISLRQSKESILFPELMEKLVDHIQTL